MSIETPQTLSVALWATNLTQPLASLSQWLTGVEARLAEAQAAGMQLLVIPELACVQWLHFAPSGLAVTQQLPWLADLAQEALPALGVLASRYGMGLLAGTLPSADSGFGGRISNRAWLLLPDGRRCFQDKLFLTPSENNPAGWQFAPGAGVQIIDWDGLRVAIVVCVDVQSTALWARLGRLDLDLILVPAKTDMLSGYYRVFGCARARAIELQTVVCVVGAVGTVPSDPATDTVTGGAAVFLPADTVLNNPMGVAAALEPLAAASGLSSVLNAPYLPVGYCRQIRHGAAEAEIWPGAWPAEHISIGECAASL